MQKNGIMIMSGFAALWGVWGLRTVPGVPIVLLLLPVLVSGTLIAFARRLPSHASDAARRRVGRVVGWASLGEFIAIALANVLLNATGHVGYVPCAIAGIVGVHFLPLAHFLRVPVYYAAGAALITLAAASCGIDDDQTRMLTIRLGAAALLWITCLSSFHRRTDAGFLAA